MRSRLFTLLGSLLAHLVALGALVILLVKPFFLPLAIAMPLILVVILTLSAFRSRYQGVKRFGTYTIGSIVAVGIFLLLVTIAGWVASTSPTRPLSFWGFISYYSRAPLSAPEWAFFLLPPILVIGALTVGHYLGMWWRSRTGVPSVATKVSAQEKPWA